VSAIETSNGKTADITIAIDQERLSKDALDILSLEAEMYRKEDAKVNGRIKAKNELELHC
jgi:hypothetical protein